MNSTIFGRIGKDAELKHSTNGTSFARFSVALNVYDKQERQTTWVQAVVFGKQAESLAPYLTKGASVVLAGDLKLREYESDNGSGVSLDMSVNSVALLGGGESKPETKSTGKSAKTRAVLDEDISF